MLFIRRCLAVAAIALLFATPAARAQTRTWTGLGAPDNNWGTLTAVGNVIMGTNSHLAIELSGGSADKLVVGGSLSLSNVDFLDITGVGQGLSWVIATYGSLTGTFNNITPGYNINYGSGTNSQITLSVNPSGVKGDFNNDGKVDSGDYLTWRKTAAPSTHCRTTMALTRQSARRTTRCGEIISANRPVAEAANLKASRCPNRLRCCLSTSQRRAWASSDDDAVLFDREGAATRQRVGHFQPAIAP